ncbi:MAG: hypothetical protein ACK40O_00915 [Allosphingosinicella sp.]
MSAESLFLPISKEAIRRARANLALAGQSVEDWASANGYKAKTVYGVLSGKRAAIRGQSLKIALALGLRERPAPLPTTSSPDGPESLPSGSVITEGSPAASCSRRADLHDVVGEAVR